MPTRRTLEYKYIYIRVFYRECLYAWSELTSTTVNSYEDVINQIIWNNKNIGIQNESIFDELLFSQGVVKTGDLIYETGKFFQSAKILQVNLSPIQCFKLMSIFDTIPPDWRILIKQNQENSVPKTLNGIIFVRVDGKDIDIRNITSKLLYKEFKFKK